MSINALNKRIEHYDGMRRSARRIALAKADEEVREIKNDMLRTLALLVEGGNTIAYISKETGLARSTIYRYLEEYSTLVPIAGDALAEWSTWLVSANIGDPIDTPWGKRPAERTRVINTTDNKVYDLDRDHRGVWTMVLLGEQDGEIEYNGIGEPTPAVPEVQAIINSIEKEEK